MNIAGQTNSPCKHYLIVDSATLALNETNTHWVHSVQTGTVFYSYKFYTIILLISRDTDNKLFP